MGTTRRYILSYLRAQSRYIIILGVVTSYFGELFRANQTLIMQIGGVIIILFGLHQAGWLLISWLYKGRKVQAGRSVGLLGAFITGLAISFGWMPCLLCC